MCETPSASLVSDSGFRAHGRKNVVPSSSCDGSSIHSPDSGTSVSLMPAERISGWSVTW